VPALFGVEGLCRKVLRPAATDCREPHKPKILVSLWFKNCKTQCGKEEKTMRHLGYAVVIGFLILSATPVLGDVLTLKNGELVIGTFEGGSAQMIHFRTSDGDLRSIETVKVQQIQFGIDRVPSRSLSKENESLQPYIIPSGSRIVVRTADAVSSEKQKVGEEFRAVLDEPIILEGVEIVPRTAEVLGRITDVSDTARSAGTAELSLELTQLTVNGIRYAISTAEYSDVSARTVDPVVGRAGAGVGVGAVGAVTGAGAGAVPAIQIVTKGEKIIVPADTRLIFTLRTPLAIARK